MTDYIELHRYKGNESSWFSHINFHCWFFDDGWEVLLMTGNVHCINGLYWRGCGSLRGICRATLASWSQLSPVNSNLNGRLPVHSVGTTSDPLCASEGMILCVCESLWRWKRRVEDYVNMEAVTRCHVMGGGEHNGHLRTKVNNPVGISLCIKQQWPLTPLHNHIP